MLDFLYYPFLPQNKKIILNSLVWAICFLFFTLTGSSVFALFDMLIPSHKEIAEKQNISPRFQPSMGWWGFAALNTASEKVDCKRTPKNVELGAVLWTQFTNPVQ